VSPADGWLPVLGFAGAIHFLGDTRSSLGDAKSSLGDAKSSLGDAKSSLGDVKSSLGDVYISLGDAKSSLGDANSSLGDVCNLQLGDWSTEGMFERERTPDYILCEAVHLSTFAVSADDIVPEFNLPDPSADLFASINLTNSLAIFVVGFILFGFSVANFVGYKKVQIFFLSPLSVIDATTW
jgi:hypothetical protein